jgi:enoyl-CoA hydratase/carnithine racemase
LALAGRIAANPVRALRLTKRLLREGQKGDSDQVLELSAAFQAIVHETKDHVEAVTAILEKRKPSFTGTDLAPHPQRRTLGSARTALDIPP